LFVVTAYCIAVITQETCATAKMTAQCALYGCPENFL